MFFRISKIEQALHHADGLQNPKNTHGPMVLGIYRTKAQTIICSVYSKRTFGEFWDNKEQKKIARRHWTPQMKAYEKQKAMEAPKPPFIFKFTVVGWLFLLLFIGITGHLIYDSVKPPLPKSEKTIAMEQVPMANDIYFGRYELYKERGTPLGMIGGFGWFKVLKVEGELYHIAKSIEMSKSFKPEEQLNSTEFELESLPPVKLLEQSGYHIRFESDDRLTEIHITNKKHDPKKTDE